MLRKALTLAAFRDACSHKDNLSRRELPIPGARRGEERLKAILEGAERWLERFREGDAV
jgi:hypothetical protein